MSVNELHAVWDGRFQPFHLGHLGVIKAILDQFQLPTVIMIIQSSIGENQSAYVQSVNIHHRPERNPLTLWERRCLISAALDAEGLSRRVKLVGILRPDLYWNDVKSFYPTRRFICLTGKDEYEKSKEAFWHSLGEQTRTIDSSGIEKISATELKRNLKSGGDWERFMHPATIDLFRAIDGVARFEAASI